jgi:hypothetical protein
MEVKVDNEPQEIAQKPANVKQNMLHNNIYMNAHARKARPKVSGKKSCPNLKSVAMTPGK